MDLWDLQIITFCFDLHFTRSGKVCPYFPAEETSCCSSVLVLIKRCHRVSQFVCGAAQPKTCQCAHNDWQQWASEVDHRAKEEDGLFWWIMFAFFTWMAGSLCVTCLGNTVWCSGLWKPRVLPPMWILLWYYCRRQISTLYLDLQLISCLVCNS